MNRHYIKYFIFMFIMIIMFMPDAFASTYINASSCGTYLLASATNTKGGYTEVQCYNTYDEAKNAMNSSTDDNTFILQGNEVIDAKYALIDYDWATNAHYVRIYSDKELSKSNYLTYVSGSYGDDAAFIEYANNSQQSIKIKVAGVTGWIGKYESGTTNKTYEIIPINWVTSPNSYTVSSSEIIHTLPGNLFGAEGDSYAMDKKPNMLNQGKYYSYDGHYFYSNIKTLLNDYKNNTYANSVNSSVPYYNYYQYLSFRTKTKYNADNINQYLNSRTNGDSKLRNTGANFIEAQEKYGTNAILMLGIGINESGWGTSPISQTNNNLFGLNANDANPKRDASVYASPGDCINEYGFTWLSGRYLQPGDTRYGGANVGDKKEGLNIQYASDPYWGEKAASNYYKLDKYFSFQDYNTYTIGILNNDYSGEVYAKKTPGGLNVSSNYYQYKKMGSSITILGEVISNGETWYKIYSDPALDSNLEYYADSVYYATRPNYLWDNGVVYVKARYFRKIYPVNEQVVDPVNPTAKPISSIIGSAGYSINGTKLYGTKISSSVSELRNKLTSAGGTVTVSGDKVATGMTVSVSNGSTTQSFQLVVYGDINGDGGISAVDYSLVKNYIMNSGGIDGVSKDAADVNKDGSVSAVDYANIKSYIMGSSNVIG